MLTRRRLVAGTSLLAAVNALCLEGSPASEALRGARTPHNGRVYHVAPGGSDELGFGSPARPFESLPRAYAAAEAGDTIVLRGGTYSFNGTASGWLLANRGGRPGNPIRIESYAGEKPVIDGSGIRPPTGPDMAWASRRSAGGFPLVFWDAPYVELHGITVCNGPMGGIHVNGSHDGFVIERCVTRDNGWLNDEHGVGLGIYGEGDGNAVRNCDSYGNHGGGPGATGGNADGFQIVLLTSIGTTITGNRAWRNTDDGFDFYVTSPPQDSRSATGYLVDNNWAFDNGCFSDGTPNAQGDGVGFKLGGRRLGSKARHGGHTVTRCIAWNNRTIGFDDNDYNGGTEAHTVFNNTAFNNGCNSEGCESTPGYAFVFQGCAQTILCNNVAFSTGKVNELLIKLALESHNVRNRIPWNVFEPPLALDQTDFETLNDAEARSARLADGSLPISGFLRPSRTSRLCRRGTIVGLPGHITYTGSVLDLGALQSL
ncbi:right-handed parallel beta-helix repeat-containing protein [Methylobacterium sp. CM6257]